MSISQEQIKEKEQEKKEILQKQISDITDSQTVALMHINKVRENLNLDADVPNIGVTLFNKISEITREFNKAGISMYVSYNEDVGIIENSFIGEAIRDDLFDKTVDGVKSLEKYNVVLKDILDQKNEKIKSELIEVGPIKKLILKIRTYFNPKIIQEAKSYSGLDLSEVNMYMDEYKRIDKELFKYNLKDNLADALTKKIIKEKNSTYQRGTKVLTIIDEKVKGDLEKLGLSELLPEIEEDLSQEIMAERIDYEYERLMRNLERLALTEKKKNKEHEIPTKVVSEEEFKEILKENKKEDKQTLEKEDDEGR